MTDQNDWYRILSLARSNAASDLATSNEILRISDAVKRMHEKDGLTEEEVLEVFNKLIKIALELSDKSKEMNFSITKLMGVV